MDDDSKLNLVRIIFNSQKFKNSSQEEQAVIMKNILKTGEVTEEQVRSLYNQSRASQLEKLPYGVFSNIILAGNIRGEDLLSLCNSSPILKEYCNRPIILSDKQEVSQYLFRQLIEKEHPGYSYQTEPKVAYEVLTTKRIDDFRDILNFIQFLNQEEMLLYDHIVYYPKILQSLLYTSTQNDYGLLSNPPTLIDSNFRQYANTKYFLDNSFSLLIMAVSRMHIGGMGPGGIYYGREGLFLDELTQMFHKNGSFPEVLVYAKYILNVDTSSIIQKYYSILHSSSLVGTIFETYPDINNVTMLWDNYEVYYLTCITALISQDNETLENMMLTRLLSIINNYTVGATNRITEIQANGDAPNEQDYEITRQLAQIKSDLESRAYHKVFKWLIAIHHGILARKYSILTPFNLP